MDSLIELRFALPVALVDQITQLAEQLGRSQEEMVALALEALVQTHACLTSSAERSIRQGDIFWITPHPHFTTELGTYTHPYVVIQDDRLNASRIPTVVVCALTSNLKQSKAPGNILLEVGEANLLKHSVVDVSKVSTVFKAHLGAYIGSLDQQRVQQIMAGMQLLQRSFFTR